MSAESNKQVVEEVIQQVFAEPDAKAIDRLVAPDFVPHTWPGVQDREGLKQAQQRVHGALSDVSMKIEDLIAEGDKVVARITAHAVQSGELMGMPASGKPYTISEIHIFRLKSGRVTEHWHNADMLGMMQQLGALPAPKKG